MSFSRETKNELARIVPDKKCCMLAEIAGFIRVSGSIALAGGGKFKILLTTENNSVSRHLKTLFKEYYGVEPYIEIEEPSGLKRAKRYNIVIGPEDMSEAILRETGILIVKEGSNTISDGIYEGLIKTKCCRKSYLRGAFLGAGTMSDPDKGYHFEISVGSETLAADIRRLFNSFVDIHAKVAERKNGYMVYLKNSGQILDMLAIMGAHSQYFIYEDVRMKKELRNDANRRRNCDEANIDKAVAAAEKQIKAIETIKRAGEYEKLSQKLKEIAEIREANPDAALGELGQLTTPPLTKAGVNGRLKRLEKIAEEIENSREVAAKGQ